MLPDLSVVWIILLVLTLTATVDRLLFRPILRIMAERADRVTAAQQLAERSAIRAKQATEEFEARTAAARGEVYGEMDARRREALAKREALLGRTRDEALATLSSAAADLEATTRDVRARLDTEAGALARAITTRVLDRQPS